MSRYWGREEPGESCPSPVLHELGRRAGKERLLSVLHHTDELLDEPAAVQLGVGPEGPAQRNGEPAVQLLVQDVH